MQCRVCGALQDTDAAVCRECGNPVTDEPLPNRRFARKQYLFALLLVPVVAAAGGAGYYKFILPDDTAAVVNGEKIMRSELDAAVARVRGVPAAEPRNEGERAAKGRLRYQVLNRLIAGRIALQAARDAGMKLGDGELEKIIRQMQEASGLDDRAFERTMEDRFGSLRAFRRMVEQERLVARLLAERIVPPGTDPQKAQALADDWFHRASRTASVRIALAEQVSSAGCSCCAKGSAPRESGLDAAGPAKGITGEAAAAGLQYWSERYGGGDVSVRTADLGCHVQVTIVKAGEAVLSLRYQDGVITEER